MNNFILKNIRRKLTMVIFVIASLSINASQASAQASAQVSGKYLSADMGEADLMAIASKYPTLFWTAFVILIIICLGYGIYYIAKKKNK